MYPNKQFTLLPTKKRSQLLLAALLITASAQRLQPASAAHTDCLWR